MLFLVTYSPFEGRGFQMNRIILIVLAVLSSIPAQAGASEDYEKMNSREYLRSACAVFPPVAREAFSYKKERVPLDIAIDTAMYERVKRDALAKAPVVRKQVGELFTFVYENDLPVSVLAIQAEKQCVEKRRFLRTLTKDILGAMERREKKNGAQAVGLRQ